ncbi:MAG: glycosyltransferase family 39 protein [Patescibacteria group bacterium]
MKRSTEILLVTGIVLLALFFRGYHLARIPTGVSPLEAYVGNQATQVPQHAVSGPLFVALQSWSIKQFGHNPWALHVIPALAGTLTVLGLYLLTRTLTNIRIASLAAFLLAVSPWHVTFSRTGFAEIMVPLFLTWGLYAYWRGISTVNFLAFAGAGILFALGMYSYTWFWLFLAVPVLTTMAYLHMLKKDFNKDDYQHVRNKIVRGIVLASLVMLLVWLPMGFNLYLDPDAVMTTATAYTPLAPERLARFITQFLQTVGMLFTGGDPDWLHGIADQPLLWWPLAALAAVGLVKSTIKLIKRRQTHGHFSAMQVLLLSWFVVGIVPSALTRGPAPDALRALGLVPVVMLIAAEGLLWFMQFVSRWYGTRDLHAAHVNIPGIGRHYMKEARIVGGVLMAALLVALATQGFENYFGIWAVDAHTARAYASDATTTAQSVLRSKPKRLTYVYGQSDYSIDGLPAIMQTFMYMSDTATPAKQKARNVKILTPLEYEQRQFPRSAPLILLK